MSTVATRSSLDSADREETGEFEGENPAGGAGGAIKATSPTIWPNRLTRSGPRAKRRDTSESYTTSPVSSADIPEREMHEPRRDKGKTVWDLVKGMTIRSPDSAGHSDPD